MIRPFSSPPVFEPAWHYLPVTATPWKRPRSYPPVVQRMLLPIQLEHLTDMEVTSVLDFAAKNKKDLVLLVLSEDSEYDQEALFSSLRGLQAHAQQFGQVSLSIDTAVGFNDETISRYADKYGVDVVILASQLSDFEAKEKEDFAPCSSNWQPLV
jgi:hypothetical protein